MELNINIDTKIFKINLVLIAILIIATVLRFYNIGFQDVWLDEISTMNVSNPAMSLAETNVQIMSKEGFPHLYWYSLKLLSFLLGHSITVLRAFSAFFGILSIYVTYLLTKELLDKNAGYIAAILLTVNPFHIWHSQEARSYSLLVFFVIFASYRLIVFIKNNNYRNAILFGIACGLIPNAHPLGVLNVGVLFLTLLFIIILEKQKSIKLAIFKQSLLSGIITLIIGLGCYPMFSKVSKATSFWIPPASFESLKTAFVELLGGNNCFLFIYVVGLLLFFVVLTIKIIKNKNLDKSNIILFCLMFSWLIINIGVIVIKSYVGISIILSRYFIGALPLFIIALTYCFSLINLKGLKYGVVVLFAVYSLYYVIITKEYYTKITKTEFVKLTNEMLKKNARYNDEIVTVWGWLFNSFIDKTKTNNFTSTSLQDYIIALKNDAITKKSFWYFDGNLSPFNLSTDELRYLDENFVLDDEITNYYDCYAKHYQLKSEPINADIELNKIDLNTSLTLNDFLPFNNDGKGNLVMLENGSIKSKVLNLEKGKYDLIINGNSFPAKPIQKQNAHLLVKENNKLIGDYFLSGSTVNKEKIISFEIKQTKKTTFELQFDNDIFINNLDRNIVLYSIAIKKIK